MLPPQGISHTFTRLSTADNATSIAHSVKIFVLDFCMIFASVNKKIPHTISVRYIRLFTKLISLRRYYPNRFKGFEASASSQPFFNSTPDIVFCGSSGIIYHNKYFVKSFYLKENSNYCENNVAGKHKGGEYYR